MYYVIWRYCNVCHQVMIATYEIQQWQTTKPFLQLQKLSQFPAGQAKQPIRAGWFCLTNYTKMEEEKGRRDEQEEKTQCSTTLFCSAEGGCSFQHLRNRRGPNKWIALYWLASISQASEICTVLIDLRFFSQSSHNFARFMFRIFSTKVYIGRKYLALIGL